MDGNEPITNNRLTHKHNNVHFVNGTKALCQARIHNRKKRVEEEAVAEGVCCSLALTRVHFEREKREKQQQYNNKSPVYHSQS